MAIVSMKTLLESGVHFGHRTHKWNPRMRPYIFTERNGIHIINLQLTVKAIEEAYALIRDVVADGGTVLFVGTKRQAQETIQMEAERCGMPYVTARWLGGFLTNWRTIRERINELERLERMRDRGEFDRLKKKERLNLQRRIDKLEMRLGGIRKMVGLPDLVFVVDVRREETAIHEANLLNIPVVAMVDTNCDPSKVDYVIPSNDDAIRAIKLLVSTVADAVVEGKALRKDDEVFEEEGSVRGEMAASAVGGDEQHIAIKQDADADLSDEDLLGAATLAKMKEEEEERAKAVAAAEAAAAEKAAAEEAASTEEGEAAEDTASDAAEGAATEETEEAADAAEGAATEEAEEAADAAESAVTEETEEAADAAEGAATEETEEAADSAVAEEAASADEGEAVEETEAAEETDSADEGTSEDDGADTEDNGDGDDAGEKDEA